MDGRSPLLLLLLFSLALQQLAISHASSTSTVRCHAAERDALMELKQRLRDPSGRLSSWVGQDCYGWKGVGCSNVTGHVIQLDLRNRQRLQSYYPDCSDETSRYWRRDGYGCKWALFGRISWLSLLSLQHLRHLDLSGNSFQGNPIPEFLGSFTRLTYLNLSAAGFRGKVPDQLGNISNLHHLDLSYNIYRDVDFTAFGGLYIENAGWISRLTSLRRLNMDWVNFKNASSWLQAMNALPHIQELRLAYCEIVSFPPHNSLLHVNFTSLTTLDLSYNDINSSVPNWLFNLTSLEQLYLGGNIDLNWLNLASISKLTSLRVLDLSDNMLQHGFVPTAFCNLCNLQTLILNDVDINDEIMNLQVVFSECLMLSLEELDLSSTGLRGYLPDWLWSMNNLKILSLSHNTLYGPVPASLGSLSSLQYLDISDNDLNGTIPEGILGHMKELVRLYLGYNSLSLSEVDLANLSATLKYLDISSNTIVLNQSYVDWIPPFQLDSLNMESCIILPRPQFPKWLKTQRVISTLYLSSTGIKDTFLTWLPTSIEYLGLGGNSLSLSEVHLANLPAALKYLDISSNTIVLNESYDDWIPPFQLDSLNMESCIILPRSQFPKWLKTQRVLSTLYLSSTGIKDTFPTWLPTSIEYLYLDGNSLSLSDVHLAILPAALKYLDISSNTIVLNESYEDWIPPFQLNSLNMESCIILPRPQFPKWLKTQRVLSRLYLSSTGIKDTIPTWLPTSIEYLYLGGNSLSLSEVHLANLPAALKYLDISSNTIVLNESYEDWIPPFQLDSLNMESCIILPRPQFPKWLQTQRVLSRLYLSSTGIKDTFPTWLPTTISYLDLSNNEITGHVPQYLSKLKYLYLSNNSFSGQLPSTINNIMPMMLLLDLSKNNLTGSIPLSICRIKPLVILKLSKNNFSGKLPNCWKNSTKIIILDLSSNKFQGGIPYSLCNMQSLQSLHLRHNNLSGRIPTCLKGCISLIILDLAYNHLVGNIPTWIEENLLALHALSLRSNDFTGNISPGLSNLEYIRVLDLSSNKFSGEIPLNFGNFSALKGYLVNDDNSNFIVYDGMWLFIKGSELEYNKLSSYARVIDLSNNGLYGYIPEEMGNLNLLQSLNLSYNYLTGEIPRNISGMQKLEAFDLSRNNLSGVIPSTLASLNFLSMLNLSYNNLSGRIPTGSQLQTFDQYSYVSNPNLCGFPLPNNCFESTTKHEEAEKEDTDYKTEIVWLSASVALGFITGFWTVCGVLICKRRWRFAFFRAADDMHDKVYVMIAVNIAKLRRE